MTKATRNAITFINGFMLMHEHGLQHGCTVPPSDELRDELMRCAAIVRKSLAGLTNFERAQQGLSQMAEKLCVIDELCAN